MDGADFAGLDEILVKILLTFFGIVLIWFFIWNNFRRLVQNRKLMVKKAFLWFNMVVFVQKWIFTTLNMLLVGLKDNLILWDHFGYFLFMLVHMLFILIRWRLEILLNLRSVINDFMVSICYDILTGWWFRFRSLLYILRSLIITAIVLILSFIFIFIFISLFIFHRWGTHYFIFAINYFIFLVIVAEKPVTVHSLRGHFRVLKSKIARVYFWQIYRLLVLECFWRVLLWVLFWMGSVCKKLAFILRSLVLLLALLGFFLGGFVVF